jgi:hypothetical protein
LTVNKKSLDERLFTQPPCLTGVAADCFRFFQEWPLARPSDYSVPTANKVGCAQQPTALIIGQNVRLFFHSDDVLRMLVRALTVQGWTNAQKELERIAEIAQYPGNPVPTIAEPWLGDFHAGRAMKREALCERTRACFPGGFLIG